MMEDWSMEDVLRWVPTVVVSPTQATEVQNALSAAYIDGQRLLVTVTPHWLSLNIPHALVRDKLSRALARHRAAWHKRENVRRNQAKDEMVWNDPFPEPQNPYAMFVAGQNPANISPTVYSSVLRLLHLAGTYSENMSPKRIAFERRLHRPEMENAARMLMIVPPGKDEVSELKDRLTADDMVILPSQFRCSGGTATTLPRWSTRIDPDELPYSHLGVRQWDRCVSSWLENKMHTKIGSTRQPFITNLNDTQQLAIIRTRDPALVLAHNLENIAPKPRSRRPRHLVPKRHRMRH
jgi:hypothetical protein